MRYRIGDLQIFVTPNSEKMMEFHGLPETEFEYPGTIRTLLFIDCGLMGGDVSSGGRDYYLVVGRMYESDNPEAVDEKHKGKLYIRVYGFPESLRFETKVEKFEWHPDGSFDVVTPSGERKSVARVANTEGRHALRDTDIQKFNMALELAAAGKLTDAVRLFREILPVAPDPTVQFTCARLIARELLMRIANDGRFPLPGTSLHTETCHYVRTALKYYDKAAAYIREDAAEEVEMFRGALENLLSQRN